MVVIADPGDALFASSDLVIHRQTEYLSPAYYTSMGFAVPAALGVMVARPELRPIVLVGDGAFQMTGMELSTIVRHGFNPIVIVLDNQGYGTERLLHAGEHAFNDIQPWHYHKLPEVLGGGTGYEVAHRGRVRPGPARAPGRPQPDEPDPRAPGAGQPQHGPGSPRPGRQEANVRAKGGLVHFFGPAALRRPREPLAEGIGVRPGLGISELSF